MEFIDNTGHIFSISSYDDNPINLEYTEQEYIFWLKESSVSINNYYIKPIRFLIDYNVIKNSLEDFDIEIYNNSKFYKLISPKYLQNKLENNLNISESIDLDKSAFVNKLILNDFYIDKESFESEENNENLIVYSNSSKFILFPFYVIGYSDIEGTFINNIIIKYKIKNSDNKDIYNYTVISVGCSFIDECEELIINGKNMGIRFPKEILKAVYNSSYYSKYADEKLLKNKLKELLLNYMNIKGECGNVKSMLNSLKWFGWNKYIDISKLLKTDNEFQNQFILDYFDIESDIKETFKYFNHTNNISLSILENKETGKKYSQNFNKIFHGEGKPILEDLFNKNVEIIKENISFYKPYYNFMFNELGLKLDCLKYYYKQYFLPVHINILRASIDHKVYANTMKLNMYANTTLVDSPLYLLQSNNIEVKFPDTNILLFKQDVHLIDSKYNEFSNYNEDYQIEDLYYVDENCITIPISIINVNNEYTKNIYGDYYKEDTIYYKINYFYKIISEDSVELSDRFNGTHYTLDGNVENIISLNQLSQRYIKISEGYFKCKLYLTVTYINQSNTGHYVYLDGKYIYKDNFYKSDLNNINNVIDDNIENYINDSYNYILYYGKYIKVDPKDRYDIQTIYLINNNDFIFYQNGDQYYKNLVIIPRILNNNIDWLNGYYRLSLSVNNKWFYYDFRIKTPNIYLDLGKLKYKYILTETVLNDNEIIETEYCPFNQLRSLNPLEFNSFMFQPDLVTINSLFKDEKNDKLLTFIDKLLEVRNGDYTMTQFYKKYYRDKIIIPYNKKYFNRIHLFDIYDENNEKIPFESIEINNENNSSEDINYTDNYIYLYQDLFNSNLSCKLVLNEKIIYDYYLMHDEKEWYMVAISQYPIASYIDESLLDIHQDIYHIRNYTIKYANYSVDKFLINRMDIVKTNGLNHFNIDDLIIASVNNNDYQFNIDLNNKWSVNKIYDINKIFEINSNSNIAIITNNNKDNLYTPGYYNLQLNYTINGLKNLFNKVIGEFKVENTKQEIEYPEIKDIIVPKEIYDIKDTITDGTILYVNEQGNRKFSKDYTTYFPGYHPIAIKIVNAGYFDPESPSIYMGLKHLSLSHPETGNAGNTDSGSDIPYFGMKNIILDIPTYDKICYYDETHTKAINYMLVQTDNIESSSVPKNIDGTPKYPAPNNRAFTYSTDENGISKSYPNILNDDDTMRTELIDETCALSDWNGKLDNELIKNLWYDEHGNMIDSKYSDWETVETMYNPQSAHFSPAVACALRYYTYGTNPGDWYVPSFAPVFFMSFNFKRYSEIFEQLNINYPDDCKSDLLKIGSNAFFTSTLPPTQTSPGNDMWDIHVVRCIGHIYSRTAKWYTIPYINIDENNNGTIDYSDLVYNINDIKNNPSKFRNYIFKLEKNNIINNNFTSLNYNEVISFNEYNIITSNDADYIGIYNNGRKMGKIKIWNSLRKSNTESIQYNTLLISDIHYNDNDLIDSNPDTQQSNDGNTSNSDYYLDLKNILSNTNNVDFITCCGDITTDNEIHFNNYKLCINKYGNNIPIYTCSGNHDTKPKRINKNGWKSIDHLNNNYTIHYFCDETFTDENNINFTDDEETSFYFIKTLSNGKRDIYIYLNVEYGHTNVFSYDTHNCRQLNQNELLVHSSVETDDIHLYNPLTLKCLKQLLERYKNDRCFIFTHLMFENYAGSYHGNDGYYKYYETHADVLKGDQGEYLDNLLKQYSNNYWFSGHSHYKWEWEAYDNTINVVKVNNSYTIHIPSLSVPLPTGITSYNTDVDASEYAKMYVYNNYIIINGYIKDNINDNKIYPLACYKL